MYLCDDPRTNQRVLNAIRFICLLGFVLALAGCSNEIERNIYNGPNGTYVVAAESFTDDYDVVGVADPTLAVCKRPTSDGLYFVHVPSTTTVRVGDRVRVRGQRFEYMDNSVGGTKFRWEYAMLRHVLPAEQKEKR